jgi:hypothetical protein
MRQGDRFVYWDTRSRAREAKLGEETNESPYFRILISSDNVHISF